MLKAFNIISPVKYDLCSSPSYRKLSIAVFVGPIINLSNGQLKLC